MAEPGVWVRRRTCVACDTVLSDKEYAYSQGVCPHCGHVSRSTFCDTKDMACRWVRTHRPSWFRRTFLFEPSIGHWEVKK